MPAGTACSSARPKPRRAWSGRAQELVRHQIFDSGHDYNQPMREAMYGWMKRWLLEEGDARPVPEPALAIEKPEDLSCYPDQRRPKGFLFPPSYAFREARALS